MTLVDRFTELTDEQLRAVRRLIAAHITELDRELNKKPIDSDSVEVLYRNDMAEIYNTLCDKEVVPYRE